MTPDEEREQERFDRKADKVAGCMFYGCFPVLLLLLLPLSLVV